MCRFTPAAGLDTSQHCQHVGWFDILDTPIADGAKYPIFKAIADARQGVRLQGLGLLCEPFIGDRFNRVRARGPFSLALRRWVDARGDFSPSGFTSSARKLEA